MVLRSQCYYWSEYLQLGVGFRLAYASAHGSLKDVSSVLITGNRRKVITVRFPEIILPETVILGSRVKPSGSLTSLLSVILTSARYTLFDSPKISSSIIICIPRWW